MREEELERRQRPWQRTRQIVRQTPRRHRLSWFLFGLMAGVLLTVNGLGYMAGNRIYEEISDPRRNAEVLGIMNRSAELETIHAYETRQHGERIQLERDGVRLTGTFVDNGSPDTVLLLHGLYQNRTMLIPYARIYLRKGYNVLLADSRGHGESGGVITWGIEEVQDIEQWLTWLRQEKAAGRIGVHGISLGGAYAGLHSGLGREAADFYVSDSAYADFRSLYDIHIGSKARLTADSYAAKGLWLYCNAAMLVHTGAVFSQVSPAEAVRSASRPMLFLHGGQDTLVPEEAAHLLYEACGSSQKELDILEHAAHAQGLSEGSDYAGYIRDFLQRI